MAMSRDTEDEWNLWDTSSAEEIEEGIMMAKNFLADHSKAKQSAEEDPELAASDPNCSLSPGLNPDREAFGGSAEAKQQLKAVDTTSASDSESSTRSHLVAPPPAQILYYIKREGVRDYSPTPIDGAKPWKCLVKVLSAPLGKWLVCLGDIVTVCQGERSEGYAKVSDLRSLDDGRYMVAYTWLYTREEVIAELQTENRLPERFRKHISQRWPIDADYRYMFSTNRTVTLWDTAISKAPHEVTSKICYSSIYSTTPSTRWIWSVDNPRFRWMKRILDMDPCPRALTTVD